ncbi:hypothetical protein [Maribellus sp. YY47]|uniref:hypothetical protein n=1 Tax=Maribellus sp. YY47 TaxID=2929486 RepID=UPI002001ADCC|nr:hypothetical protein [Maribellus sp. YY47]MCK3685844.1 hypothetical protein [Maribellus sp. YY47]
MKSKKLRLLATFLLLLPLFVVLLETGCDEKEENTIPVCGIENPFVNLDWLKSKKNALQTNSEITSAIIDLYRLDDADYIVTTIKLSSVYDYPGTSILNCDGTKKYTCGGNQAPGLDSCSTFFNNAQKIETLWEK